MSSPFMSSGSNLITLINTRSLDIARSEVRNDARICLYGTGEYWTAFERSAYYLSRIFPNLDSFVVNHPDSPFPIVGISVSDTTLRQYLKTHSVRCQGNDYIELTVTTPSTAGYSIWHSRKVKFFMV